MAFHHLTSADVDIDDIISTIMTELETNGGWTELDAGYNVMRNPDATFDIFWTLEADDKRFITVDIGTWDTGAHAMDGAYIRTAHVLYDHAAASPAAGNCNIDLSYDDDYLITTLDMSAVGADYRKSLVWSGLADPIDSGTTDSCLVASSTLPRGATTNPAGVDTTTQYYFLCLKNISGVATKPKYAVWGQMNPLTMSNGAPRGTTLSNMPDYRYLRQVMGYSDAGAVTGGEDAGVRFKFQSLYIGYADDAETHGQTILAADAKEYQYFIQPAAQVSYCAPLSHLWYRVV
jgi:hypothetical protein